MNQKSDGGPAFPKAGLDPWGQAQEVCTGMTLRDYFAAQALTTCLGYEKTDIERWEPVDFAQHAYQVADAMLAERAK